MKDNKKELLEMERQSIFLDSLKVAPAIANDNETIVIHVECDGDAEKVLSNARGIMSVVSSQSIDNWPETEQWEILLPQWFLDRCGPALSEDELEKWMEHWRKLSIKEQQKMESESDWSLPDWIYWMCPLNRQWYWASSSVTSVNGLSINIISGSWTFAWGSLRWLLFASGGRCVTMNDS